MPFYRKNPEVTVPWEDVYVTFKDHRKTVHWGPCFEARPAVDKALAEVERKLKEPYVVLTFDQSKLKTDFNDFINNPSKRKPTAEELEQYRKGQNEERESRLNTLLAFDNGAFMSNTWADSDPKKTPTIAVNVPALNFESIERAVALGLQQYFDLRGPFRFWWYKPKFFVQPV